MASMEFYTLNNQFHREVLIDEFESAIWTERYTKAGDVTLVVPASIGRVKLLYPGTCISLNRSKEIMRIETQSIEDNMLTITGSSLEKIFNERVIYRGYNYFPDGTANLVYIPESTTPIDVWKIYKTPGQTIAEIVSKSVIGPMPGVDINSSFANWAYTWSILSDPNRIKNLILGPIADGGNAIHVSLAEHANLYTEVLAIAEHYQLGLSLYLNYANDGFNGQNYDYQLEFSVYQGIDRTKSQTVNQLLRFSPDLDSLANVKELRSVDKYKNVVYVFAPIDIIKDYPNNSFFYKPVVVATPFGEAPDPVYDSGMGRRVAHLIADNITKKMIDKLLLDPTTANAEFQDILMQKGLAFLANNKLTRVIDGEVVPRLNYVYNKDYKLGDIAEVESYIGKINKVRITEYIRSQDQTGQREYPTLSQIFDENDPTA